MNDTVGMKKERRNNIIQIIMSQYNFDWWILRYGGIILSAKKLTNLSEDEILNK